MQLEILYMISGLHQNTLFRQNFAGVFNVNNPFRRTAAEKRTINFCYLHRVIRDGVQAKSGQPGVLLSQDGICVLQRDNSKVILLIFY